MSLEFTELSIYLQYVVMPTRRSTAEAFQILISHAFGDAGSPYLIGVVSIQFELFHSSRIEISKKKLIWLIL